MIVLGKFNTFITFLQVLTYHVIFSYLRLKEFISIHKSFALILLSFAMTYYCSSYTIEPVVYYNPQLFLVSFPINRDIFSSKFFFEVPSAWAMLLAICDLSDMYALMTLALVLRIYISGKSLVPTLIQLLLAYHVY